MTFTVIIPARMASVRLPGKPLAELDGKPMVVQVAQRAALSGAAQVIVATDHVDIMAACREHAVNACMTRPDHVSGTDRVAEAARMLGLELDAVVVNVQGDEPLINPTLIDATAAQIKDGVVMSTAAYPIDDIGEMWNPNVVKVVLDKAGRALYFSRAALPWHRAGFAQAADVFPDDYQPLRHIGLYGYKNAFLQTYPALAVSPLEQSESLEQLRVLWHGFSIFVHVSATKPQAGIDTPEDLKRVRHYFELENKT